MSDRDRYERGTQNRRQVLGDAHVDRAVAGLEGELDSRCRDYKAEGADHGLR